MLDKLNRVREGALARGVPAAEVERWLAAARPCATLAVNADGPVVGRIGGPVLHTAGTPRPREVLEPIATLDLGALPEDATGLPLPRTGRLHLLAAYNSEDWDAVGTAVYLPADAPIQEHPFDHEARHATWEGLTAPLEGELRLAYDVSLPDNEVLYDPAEHPHAEELRAAWSEVRYADWCRLDGMRLQIGGYSTDSYGEDDPITAAARAAARAAGEPEGPRASPWERPRPEDWALLAQWSGSIGGFVYWLMARRDAAAGRFDRNMVLGFFEGP
jgi:hypothetical protein